MFNYHYYIADVFTDTPFGGNQLAVFPHAKGLSTLQMQAIAKEFNFSETTFVLPSESESNDFKVRIFTPQNELPTAGHPTIGTSHVLLHNEKYIPKDKGILRLEEGVGTIPVTYSGTGWLTMSQPLPEFGSQIDMKNEIAEILSLSPEELSDDLPIQRVSCGNNFLYIPVKSLKSIEKIKIRTDLLEKYSSQLQTTELYTFSFETMGENTNIHARLFAPLFGIIEDPATGSAAGPLGCYLIRHNCSDGKNICIEQGLEMGRPSTLHVEIEHQNNDIKKVLVSGQTVVVALGEMFV